MNILRTSLAISASAAVVLLAGACGGSKTAVCSDATKAFNDYSTQVAAAATNLDGINQATTDLASKLKELAGKADGDLASSLTKMADTFGGFKIDAADPTAAAGKLTEFTTKAGQAAQELASACS
ncbi:hypothetical protein J5X84_01120 [Streptosporangiaceae bacterium NEAU-GS5]|nr:hypothetical protein [Streptosporangiaceae bacterium NEAU-GS5]